MLPQEEFDIIVQQHAAWLTGSNEGKRANFREQDLRACIFGDANLSQAIFRSAILEGMDLRDAILERADFSEANLRRTKLDGANLKNAVLNYTQAPGASFAKANLEGTHASNANFVSANFRQAFLENATMRECYAAMSDLTAAIFINASLRANNFTQCKLEATNFKNTDCRDCDFSEAIFSGSILENTNLRDTVLENISFLHTDFSGALDMAEKYHNIAIAQAHEDITLRYAAINTERQKLKTKEQTIKTKTRALEAQIEALKAIEEEETFLDNTLKHNASLARYYAGLWLVIVAALSGAIVFTWHLLPLQKLDISDIVLLIIVLSGILTLHFLTALQPSRIAQIIQNHQQVRAQRLESLENPTKKSQNNEQEQ